MSKKSPKNEVNRPKGGWLWRLGIKALIVVAAVVVLVVIGMMPGRDRTAPPSEAPPVNVAVMQVVAEPELADTFVLPAVVEPNRVVTVSAEVAGRVERILPDEGDTVQAGDLLIQLNADLIKPQFQAAEALYKRKQIEFQRMKELVEMDATSRQDLDNATTDLASSKAQLEEVQARLERTRIHAPIAGVLNDLPVEEGEYVQPGAPVAELVETDVVKVVVEVPERDIAFFEVGQKSGIVADVKDREHTLAGVITFISELADRQTRSTRLEITVDNEAGLLRSGQIVRAQLTRRVLKDAIMVPLLAVIPMETGQAVYVVNSEEAKRREIVLDIIQGDRVQVVSGLEAGDQLIVAGHRFVAPGQKVNVVSKKN